MFEPDSADTSEESADSFTALYRREAGWLNRFFQARLRSAEDAPDLVQETMVRFLRASERTTIEASQHYLRRIAANVVRKHVARDSTKLSQNSIPFIEDMEAPIGTDPHRELEGREELDHWDAVLTRLPQKTREIFLLSRVDGWTYKEIAAQYRMTVWGVKKHMMKAIAHIDRNRRAG
jgi:RNA polymerase sigma-70 factor (ECF subfamily)